MELLRAAPRWSFLCSLIYAPWDYGGVPARSVAIIEVLLAITVALWVVDLLISRSRPQLPWPLVVVAAVLVIVGWWMALNGRATYDTDFDVFVPLGRFANGLSGSVDRLLSTAWMIRVTLLLATLCFVADLIRRPEWLLRIWIAVGVAGGSVAVLGLLQKATDAQMIFWGEKLYNPFAVGGGVVPLFFATFYYHANAGAFLNLVFPFAAGLALRAFERLPSSPAGKAIWFTTTLLLVAAVFANTSRASQLIGLLAILAVAAGPARRIIANAMGRNRPAAWVTITTIALAVAAVALVSGVTTGFERWQSTLSGIGDDGRWTQYRTAAPALADAGWLGFGPGTFQVVFPQYEPQSEELQGALRHLHQDYLQTVVEWGWLGTAGWALLLGGGIATAIRALKAAHHGERSRIHRVLPLTLIALGTVMLHALIDFPLQIASLQLYTVTYLGICWSAIASSRPRLPVEDS